MLSGQWNIQSSGLLRLNFCSQFFLVSLQCRLIKMKTLPLWIFGLLLISLTGAHELTQFPENFVVAKENDANPVTLTCGTKTEGAIKWKFHGEGMDDVVLDENTQQVGQNLAMSDVGLPMLGQYSCWSGGEMVSSTYLLLEEEEEAKEKSDNETEDSPIHCRAKSYDCKFSCKWTKSGLSAVRFGLGHECREGRKSCQWFSGVELPDGGFQVELSHHLSPYAEESTKLEITAEAIINLSFVRRTERFYLRDIVQPDSPQIVRCQEVGEDLNVTIQPPSSWSTPHSFFCLEHQIQYELKDNGKVGLSSSALIPKRISKLRVRSQDPLVLSTWSQWTPWKNVRIRQKQQNKCRNKAKPRCPELPSESLEDCKKKGKKKGKKDAQRSQTS